MGIREASTRSADSTYVFGHVDHEVGRLLLQGRLYDEFTEHVLRLAGLQPGMQVLDVGSGPGDVSFAAARIVGPTGTVLGVDAAADIVELARKRAADKRLLNVHFETTTIDDLSLNGHVDAVIGRLILMHLPDPVAALRNLAARLRPGGIVSFIEVDSTASYSAPELPLWRAIIDGTAAALTGVGIDPAFGTQLHTVFELAGLVTPRLTLGTAARRADDPDIVAYGVDSWRAVLPLAERVGKVPDELVDLDTLAQRLHDQATAAHALVILPLLLGAWARV
jgi:ubiquinone/menaquinone biosynthesis C-methylase UbiE